VLAVENIRFLADKTSISTPFNTNFIGFLNTLSKYIVVNKKITYILVMLLALFILFFGSGIVFADSPGCIYNETNDCYIPADNCYLTDRFYSKICPGTYKVDDTDKDGFFMLVSGHGMVLDCQGATLIFNTTHPYAIILYNEYAEWPNTYVRNATIKNCNIINAGTGISDWYGGHNNTFINNTIINATKEGIMLYNTTHSVVINNTISSFEKGIHII